MDSVEMSLLHASLMQIHNFCISKHRKHFLNSIEKRRIAWEIRITWARIIRIEYYYFQSSMRWPVRTIVIIVVIFIVTLVFSVITALG